MFVCCFGEISLFLCFKKAFRVKCFREVFCVKRAFNQQIILCCKGGGLHDGGEQEMKMCIEWIVLIVFSEFVVDILLHAASDILGASAGAHAFIV